MVSKTADSSSVSVPALPIGGGCRLLPGLADAVGAFTLPLHARMHPPLHTLTVAVTVTVTVRKDEPRPDRIPGAG